MIEEPLYREVLRSLPIACVDVVVRVGDQGYLLIRRASPPLQGQWWTVGGRIHRGETAPDAAVRKLRDEVGVGVDPSDLTFVGYYEDRYDRDAFGPNPCYHTLSLVFEVTLPDRPDVRLDVHAADWTLSPELPARLRVISPSSTSDPGRSHP